jgi:hypothetical protein
MVIVTGFVHRVGFQVTQKYKLPGFSPVSGCTAAGQIEKETLTSMFNCPPAANPG